VAAAVKVTVKLVPLYTPVSMMSAFFMVGAVLS
jgi:hypothetical protein